MSSKRPQEKYSSSTDLTTYKGRVKHFISLIDPRLLLASDEYIKKAKHWVELAEAKKWDELEAMNVSESEYRNAFKVVETSVHPITKDHIPLVGRLSAFIPLNIPISAGILLTAPTVGNAIFWQWVNQTYNSTFNYCNSSKSKSQTSDKFDISQYSDIFKGYGGAVAVSVSLAVGLTQWLKKARLSPSTRSILQAVVPYTAVASAGVSNVILMRSAELKTGIPINTVDGTYIGHSTIAAKSAIQQAALSRAVLSFPILAVPPPIIAVLCRIPAVHQSRMMSVIAQLSAITMGVALGLPCAVGLFPQTTAMPIDKMELEIQKKVKHGSNDKFVYFNRGL